MTIHGEMFVCVDEAVAQARRFRTSWQSEVVRYLIHGILHLLGHDDHRAEDRRRMKRAEDRLLHQLDQTFALRALAARATKADVRTTSRMRVRSALRDGRG